VRRERLGDRRWQPACRRGGGVELGQELICAGPLFWVLGQAALDQRPELGGKATDIRRSENYPVQQCVAGPGAERPFTGGGEGKHRAQAEHIAGRADPVASGLFGGHETRRAEYHASARQHARLRCPGDAEIDDPRSVLSQQQVRWLQITVHDARCVDRAQALGQSRRQREHGRGRQRAVPGDRLGE
jgi:hypothetical protein